MALLKRGGLDGFVLALIAMIILAWVWPGGGDSTSFLPLAQIANFGVSVIFFFYGLRLSATRLIAGLSKWRLHILVQLTTFCIFPLLVLGAKFILEHDKGEIIWIGVFFLSCLPSTVSSSVVMVSIAGGNLPAAIFNASISSLIGVFMTPLWMGLVIKSDFGNFDLVHVIGKLVLQVLLPVILGFVLHSRWGTFAERYRAQLRYFDQSVILLIVYTSFCESFSKHMFNELTVADMLVLAGSMVALFGLVYIIVRTISRLLAFNSQDTITAVFCGSKKSLVHGTVMSKVLFPGSAIVGIILLPLMLYHALQLIIASIIAQSMSRRGVISRES